MSAPITPPTIIRIKIDQSKSGILFDTIRLSKPEICEIKIIYTELIAAVAEASGKSKADVKDVLDALTAQIVKTVKAGDEISLVGFGTFKSAKREARTGRNPATGATIQIPASVQPKFVAGKQFKDALNTK